MVEEKLEQEIRIHLQKQFHLYMKHYRGEVTIHKQFPYHVDIVYENAKTKSQIHVTNIIYDIYEKAYIIGEIKMVQYQEQEHADEFSRIPYYGA